MSPNTPNDFIGSLVEMAEAYRELPKVQEALSDAQREIAGLANTVARLEAKLMDRSNEITAHLATIRSLEVERDDAQFHALEADDRTQRALDFIKATFGNAGTLIQALEPPAKPTTPDVSVQAVPEAAKAEGEAQGVSVPTDPTTVPNTSTGSTATIGGATGSSDAPSFDHTTEWSPSSEASAPEVAPMQASPTQSDATIPMAETQRASASDTVSPEASATGDRGKYHGMTFSEAKNHFGSDFTWPSRDEWLDNGGTLDNFYA